MSRTATATIEPAGRPKRRRRSWPWVLGGVIVMLGVVTALAGSVAVEPSRAAIDWWEQQSSAIVRLTSAVVLTLGISVAYACAPPRRAAMSG